LSFDFAQAVLLGSAEILLRLLVGGLVSFVLRLWIG
jgi:hypothetical protein